MSGERRPGPPLRLEAGVDLGEHVHAWLTAPELGALVAGFGGDPPEAGERPADLLARLDAFSQVWDVRQGLERNQVADGSFGPERDRLVLAAATAGGQLDTRPPHQREWDVVIVLGGLLRACLSRPTIAARLVRSGQVQSPTIVGVGALRDLNAAERTLAAQIADIVPPTSVPGDELEAMTFGFRRAFGLEGAFGRRGETDPEPALSWRILTYAGGGPHRFQIFAAPSANPPARANTATALSWYAEQAGLAPGTSVLLINTEQYRHYSLVDAARTLGLTRQIRVDCVGVDAADADPRLALATGPVKRAQEIRSSIRALARLVAALPS